jgi:hypothetical protein
MALSPAEQGEEYHGPPRDQAFYAIFLMKFSAFS